MTKLLNELHIEMLGADGQYFAMLVDDFNRGLSRSVARFGVYQGNQGVRLSIFALVRFMLKGRNKLQRVKRRNSIVVVRRHTLKDQFKINTAQKSR